MMATFMLVLVPRAVGVRRPHRGGARHRRRRWSRRSTPSPRCTGRGSLELRDVGFHYPGADEPVLDGISFTSLAGQTTAIIGSTGAGKTTLVNLVARLVRSHRRRGAGGRRRRPPTIDPTCCGAASASCRRSRTCSPGRWRATCASATRRQRRRAVGGARDRPGARLRRAMPGGLDAPIAQGGTNVSGGQRQRLAIARALVRRPEIYLFDDSFSALDLATDARLRAALAPVTADSTVIDRRPARVDHQDRRPDPRARGRPHGRARARTVSCWTRARRTSRSSSRR